MELELKKKYNNIVNIITTKVKISKKSKDIEVEAIGLWDTGAMNTAISKNIVKKLGLKPISKIAVQSATGKSIKNTYIINISLTKNIVLKDILVVEMDNIKNADILIGMNIINKGIFCLNSYNNKSIMSFKIINN